MLLILHNQNIFINVHGFCNLNMCIIQTVYFQVQHLQQAIECDLKELNTLISSANISALNYCQAVQFVLSTSFLFFQLFFSFIPIHSSSLFLALTTSCFLGSVNIAEFKNLILCSKTLQANKGKKIH